MLSDLFGRIAHRESGRNAAFEDIQPLEPSLEVQFAGSPRRSATNSAGVTRRVAVIGHIHRNRRFRVLRFDRWLPHEDFERVVQGICELCIRFRIQWIAADDVGHGRIYNRLVSKELREKGHSLRGFYGMLYTADTQTPTPHGVIMRWQIGRTATIGGLLGRIKTKLTSFPRITECASFLDELVNVVGEFDDKVRTVQYTKPDDRQDDSVHALNYAELVGMRLWDRINQVP